MESKNYNKLVNITKEKQSHRCREQTSGYQGVRGGGINWETEIDIYTLLYIKIDN